MHRNPKNGFFKIVADPTTPLGRAFRSAPTFGYFQNCREIREREVASFGGHGMTLSARSRIELGILMTSALAVSSQGPQSVRHLSVAASYAGSLSPSGGGGTSNGLTIAETNA